LRGDRRAAPRNARFVYYCGMKRSVSKQKRPAREAAEPAAMSSRRAHARALVEWVARGMKVALSEVKGPSRLRSLSRVRALAGYLGREIAGVPIAAVAREVDRDPSTLWRDVEWLEGEMKRDRELRSEVGKTAAACAAWVKGSAAARRR